MRLQKGCTAPAPPKGPPHMLSGQSLQLILGLGATLLLGAGLAMLAERWHVPDIVFFLLLGVALGPTLLGIVRPTELPGLAQAAVLLGAAYLLFEGGRSLDAKEIRAGWRSILLLATLGVLVTTVVVALAAHLAFGLDAGAALVVGAVLAPTDPAAIVPVLSGLRVVQRMRALLVAESAANDATGAALAFALASGGYDVLAGLGHLGWSLLLGLVVGGAVGLGLHWLEGRLKGAQHGLRPLMALAALSSAFALGTLLSASAFLAVFVAGLLAGRSHSRLRRRDPVAASFYEYSAGILSRLTRLIVFVLLGASLVPSLLYHLALPALAVTLALMLVARPLTVLLLHLDRRAAYRWQELLLASWVRETGVVPGALAALLLAQGSPQADVVAACVFAAVVLTLLVQAPTTRALAHRLGLVELPQDS